MRLKKEKAYENNGQILVYDGKGLIDSQGEYSSIQSENLKRSEENDKISKFRILLKEAKARNSQPFEYPKDKTIVKVYYWDGRVYYGVVKNGIIFTTANEEIRCKNAIFEKAKVNKDQKKILIEIYSQNRKIDELRKSLDTIREDLFDALEKKEKLCKKARTLTNALIMNEFVEKFNSYLSPEIKKLMDLYSYHTKNSSIILLASNEIIIERTAVLEEWHYSDMVYEEYDNTFHMAQDEKALKLQVEYKKKYSKPLPIKWPLKQELYVGDKRTLYLTEGYVLKVEDMSEEGAKNLAEKFNESF